MKILYFFCGEGLGHTTRTIAAAQELSKKHEVVLASYGYAKEFAEKSGFSVKEVPSEISLVGKAGTLSIKDSIITTLKKTKPSEFLVFNSIIKKENPALVISDSFYLPALIAHMKKIPVWMILNQINVKSFFSDKGIIVRFTGTTVEKFNIAELSRMEKILIPDYGMPYTLCEKNLEGMPQKLFEKMEFIGPLIRKNISEAKNKEKPKTVYVSIGGFGYRKAMLEKIINVAKKMPDYEFRLICGPNANIKPKSGNAKCYPSIANPLDFMNESSIIVTSGGHSTLSEAIALGKPVISLPDMYHKEQEANATQIQALGLGARINYKTPEEVIEELIIQLSEDKEMKKRLKHYSILALKMDGRKKLLKMTEEIE